jgi:hypothetical protein
MYRAIEIGTQNIGKIKSGETKMQCVAREGEKSWWAAAG